MRHLFSCLSLLALLAVSTVTGWSQTATYTNLHSLVSTTDGQTPYDSVVQAWDGNLYGTTYKGGTSGDGTIFRITPAGVFTTLYSFTGGNDGATPQSGLIQGVDGNLYGLAQGGINGSGVIFRISTSGTFTLMYSFTSATEGTQAVGGLTEGSDGNFYGTNASGGTYTFGTVFQFSPTLGAVTVIHAFSGVDGDNGVSYTSVLEGTDGNFYGTSTGSTADPAYYSYGDVWKVSPAGVYTTLYEFKNGTDGADPDAGVIEGPDGSYYGTTHNAGKYANDDDDTGQGAIYKVTADGTYTLLYDFLGATDSGRPEGTLTLGSDGNFYGTTTNSPKSTIFRVTPAGVLTTLYGMTSGTDGSDALAAPNFGGDGNLYGTNAGGGTGGYGTIYKAVLSTPVAAPVQLTLSNATASLGNSVTLTWQVSNAFSNTMQRCAAFVGTGGGAWTGVQKGTLTSGLYGASATITPSASGTYTYALTCGGKETGFATLTVPPMTFTATSVPDGTVNAAYTTTLNVQNGLAPYTWSLFSGKLPAGLSLNATTGVMSGTPTASGSSTFTVQVKDSESSPVILTSTITMLVSSATPSIQATPGSVSVKAGGTGSIVLTTSGFSSTQITFACSGLPTGAACNFGTFSGSQSYGSVALQVSTQALLSSQAKSRNGLTLAFAFPGILALAGLVRARRKQVMRSLCVLLLLVSGVGMLSGCGGSSSTGTTTKTPIYGTPTGTSSVTVTATAGSQTATTTFSLIVQ